jgi:hypothetical protein
MTDDQRDRPRPPTDRDARRAALVVEITARLRRVCQHMSDDEFARLVADIAETRLRFAAIDASYPPRPQPQVRQQPTERGNRTDEASA